MIPAGIRARLGSAGTDGVGVGVGVWGWGAAVVILVIARSFAFVWWPDVHFDADQAVTGLMASHLIEGRAFPVFQYAQEYVLVIESWMAAPLMAIWPGSIAALRSVPVAINVATAVLLFLTVANVLKSPPLHPPCPPLPLHEKSTGRGIGGSALLGPNAASAPRPDAVSGTRPNGVSAVLLVAFLATLPVALPGPMTSADLTDALGMNIEPLFFAVLLWRWRAWPVALGIAAAVAMKNREFTIYALAALVALDLIRYGIDRIPALARWRESRAVTSPAETSPAETSPADAQPAETATAVDWQRFWRGRAVAAVCFAIAWAAIGAVKQYSTPFGPGTAFGILADSRDNTAVAASAMCIVPAKMPGDLWTVAAKMLPLQLGAGDERHQTARLYAHTIGNYSWLSPPLAIVLIGGIALGLVRAYRRGPSAATYFGVYLVLIGAQAVLVYALTRCGNVSVFTLRYTLLVLLAPAGAIILALERESRPAIRAIVTVTLIAWASVCAFAHVRLIRDYATDSPRAAYRELAHYLDSHDIRFIVTDYWTGYHVAYLTRERVKALTDFERIHEYTLAVRANLDRAMDVRRNTTPDQPCAGTLVGGLFCVCPPQTQTDRTR
jgi:hypothetical protein